MVLYAGMDDGARLKLIILGLVLAGIAGAYLVFSGRFANTSKTKVSNTAAPIRQQAQASPSTTPTPLPTTTASTLPNSGISSLPSTGVPDALIGALGAGAIVIGFALRKYPK